MITKTSRKQIRLQNCNSAASQPTVVWLEVFLMMKSLAIQSLKSAQPVNGQKSQSKLKVHRKGILKLTALNLTEKFLFQRAFNVPRVLIQPCRV